MELLERRRTKMLVWTLVMALAALAWGRWWPMPPMFDTPRSTVLLDRDGGLLGATVAADGQWRMPGSETLPTRFERCLLEFEDRNFHGHAGVHPPSLFRAWRQNRRAGRTVSGGSTITMQVARMSGEPGLRSHARKLSEIVLALRIELRYSKGDILRMYASNAPFGGNVVGLEAAAWRWFGRSPDELSWAESATLAVLPNAPAQLHPGRNRDALRAKRDRLLGRLLQTGTLDSLQWTLALAEPLPDAPIPLPREAPHLLASLQRGGYSGHRINSTVDGALQRRANEAVERYAPALRANEVHNAAILILDLPTGRVLAYVGNVPSAGMEHAGAVDIVQSRRSTGSLLKPFLYAAMLQAGELAPDQLVADLPTQYEGFAPRNFDRGNSGAVPASQALARSLNVPAVRALREHGVERTLRMLRAMGLHHVDRSADNYGLSLILGGAESTLWELTGAYASLGRILLQHGQQKSSSVHPPLVIEGQVPRTGSTMVLSPAAVHHSLLALQLLERPEFEAGWKQFAGSERIAWKTGTSFGHRDAWAIGVTERHAVGVWTGNASGEGRPGLTGTLAAAPLLFELFAALPLGVGFEPPYDDLERMAMCRMSGHRAGPDCTPVDTTWTIAEAIRTAPCPYHRRILLNAAGTQRTRPGEHAHPVNWFVLPPAMAHYYATSNPAYRPLPPWDHDAADHVASEVIELIYPDPGSRIHIPVLVDGTHGQVVLQAAHRERDATLHWDLNGAHLGTTQSEHRLTTELPEGLHRLTLTDRSGRSISVQFRVDRGQAPEP